MGIIGRFKADRGGSVGVIFGVSLIPIMGLAAGALDYSRASALKVDMQRAADAAALAIVKDSSTLNGAEIQAKAEGLIRSMLGRTGDLALGNVTATRVGNTVNVAVGGSLKSAMLQSVGVPTMGVGAVSQATWGVGDTSGSAGSSLPGTKIELALVLDNTGSMNETISGQRKIDALKTTATKEVLDKLHALATGPDTVKVSVVPFDTEVRLNADANRNQPWFRWGNSPGMQDKASWTGYLFDRYGSYATADAAPSTGTIDSLFPAPRDTEYRDDKVIAHDLAPMRPLTSLANKADYNAISATISAMQPRGNTNIALGVDWGLATLSPSTPFTEGTAFGTPGVKKIMIVLTDGDNTMNHVDGARNFDVNKINATTLSACATAKKAGVTVYTIRLLDGNANLLKSCATGPDMYFDVQNSSQLSNAFHTILDDISGTRLSM